MREAPIFMEECNDNWELNHTTNYKNTTADKQLFCYILFIYNRARSKLEIQQLANHLMCVGGGRNM